MLQKPQKQGGRVIYLTGSVVFTLFYCYTNVSTIIKLSKCVVSFQMTQNDTCVIQMTQMTQHKTTQNLFFTYLINFRKYHCYWRFLSKICQKNWNFFFNFFFEIFAIIFLKIYIVRKKNFVSFCVVSCRLKDTCVESCHIDMTQHIWTV